MLVDRPDNKAVFLVLASASPDVVRGASETLAGRVEFVELSGFDLSETGPASVNKLWVRGGFPRSFLARSNADSMAWREGFVRTFLERDIPQLGINIPASAMRRFWTMLAHYHGQTWNASELARSMGLTDKTVRSYLDILTATFMVRQLQPWFENIAKRQVKAPKIYLRDSDLLHTLLTISTMDDLLAHPRAGASWEGFAVEQVLRAVNQSEPYFFLVDPWRRGARSLLPGWWTSLRRRSQNARSAQRYEVHARRARRPEAGSSLDHLPRNGAI